MFLCFLKKIVGSVVNTVCFWLWWHCIHACFLYCLEVTWYCVSQRSALHNWWQISYALPGENNTALYLFIKPWSDSFPYIYPHFSLMLTTATVHAHSLTLGYVRTEQGKTAFSFYAPDKWNRLQNSIKLEQLIPLNLFRVLLQETLREVCTCFS